MKSLFIALFCLSLTACVSTGPMVVDDLRIPPSEAMKECPPIAEFVKDAQGEVNMADLINKLAEAASQYNGCARFHKQLIEYVNGNKK